MSGTSQSRDKDTPPHACLPLCLCLFFGFLISDSDVPIVPCFGFWEYKWYPQQLQLFLPKRLRNTRSISESGWGMLSFLFWSFHSSIMDVLSGLLFFFLYFPSKQRWYCSKNSYIIYINPWFLFYRIPNQDAIPNQQKTSVQKVGQKTPPNSAGIRKHIHTKSLPNCWFEPPISKKMYIVKIEKTHLPQHFRVFSAIVCWVAGSPNYPRGPIQKNLSIIVFQLSSRKWPKATPISSFLRELIYQNLQKLGTLGR